MKTRESVQTIYLVALVPGKPNEGAAYCVDDGTSGVRHFRWRYRKFAIVRVGGEELQRLLKN